MRFVSAVVLLGVVSACGTQSEVRCLPSNCSGCCSDDDECVSPSASQCGLSGSHCIACGTTQQCVTGLCLGGNTGGGTGITGGGTAATGGGDGTGGGDPTGGGAAVTGGGTAATGGGSAVTGGGTAVTGGGSAVTGGGSAVTGGGSAVTGGGTAVTGGGTGVTGGGSAVTGGGTGVTGGGTAVTGGGTGHLVINELDYDNPGTDSSEFVELFNGTGGQINLANYSVWLVNGADGGVYRTVDLADAGAGLLDNGKFVVLASSTTLASVPITATKVTLSGTSNLIQNGPDAVALVLTSSQTIVDSISYGGDTVMNGVSLTEGSGSTASLLDDASDGGSIARVPNGVDTNQNASDWVFTTRTPGLANQ